MNPKLSDLPSLLRETVKTWLRDGTTKWSAALAYFTIFALSPLLFLIIAIVSLIYGETAAENQLLAQVSTIIGSQAAQLIQTILTNAQDQGSGIIATVVGIATILFAATGIFTQLKEALNHIWGVVPNKTESFQASVKVFIRNRLWGFVILISIGLLFIAFMAFSAFISTLSPLIQQYLNLPISVIQLADIYLSFILATILFTLVIRFLSDVTVAWLNIVLGSMVAAFLFTIGMMFIDIYITFSGIRSTYGAAGALTVLLFWLFFSYQVFFFGVELVKTYSQRYGYEIKPNEYVHKPESSVQTFVKEVLKDEQVTSLLALILSKTIAGLFKELFNRSRDKKSR